MCKPVLAVDFDDVFAGFHQAFTSYHNDTYGTYIQYSDIISYNMAEIYGTDDETIISRVFDFYHNHHDLIEPIEDAIRHLWLLKDKYRLEVVTARCESTAPVTLGWKLKHTPKLFEGAHFANGYGTKFPERKRSKLEICKEIGAVAFIDDAIGHVNSVAEGLSIPVFLPNRPWNTSEKVVAGVTRFDDWDVVTRQLMP